MKFEQKWKEETRPTLQKLASSKSPFISRKNKTLAMLLIINIDKVLKGEKQQFAAMLYLTHYRQLARVTGKWYVLPREYKIALRTLVKTLCEITREYNRPKPYLIPLKLREV